MDEIELRPRNKFFLMGAQLTAIGAVAAESTDRIANSLARIDERLASQSPKKDNVVALYAAAIDTTGEVVERTYAGRWICSTGYTSLKDIAKRRGNREKRRESFVGRMREGCGQWGEGLQTTMTDEEIGRFFDLAPAVWASIEESQAERGMFLGDAEEDDPLEAKADSAEDAAEVFDQAAAQASESPPDSTQKGSQPSKEK